MRFENVTGKEVRRMLHPKKQIKFFGSNWIPGNLTETKKKTHEQKLKIKIRTTKQKQRPFSTSKVR